MYVCNKWNPLESKLSPKSTPPRLKVCAKNCIPFREKHLEVLEAKTPYPLQRHMATASWWVHPSRFAIQPASSTHPSPRHVFHPTPGKLLTSSWLIFELEVLRSAMYDCFAFSDCLMRLYSERHYGKNRQTFSVETPAHHVRTVS